MASAVKRKLSGSTDGKPIKVAATATAGTLVHTAVAGTTPGTFDEVWLWASNGHSAAVLLTIEYGDATSPDSLFVIDLPQKVGLVPILPGLILQNGLTVRVFAPVANVVNVVGFVNAVTD